MFPVFTLRTVSRRCSLIVPASKMHTEQQAIALMHVHCTHGTLRAAARALGAKTLAQNRPRVETVAVQGCSHNTGQQGDVAD